MSDDKLKKILLVEDEKDIQEVAKMALENVGGYEVDICDSGEFALEKAKTFKPHLILMDIMMPGMDGTQAFKILKNDNVTSDIPVIFMTAKAQPSEIEFLRNLGALDVIPKPFDPITLSEKIQEIWGLHQYG